VPRQPAANEHDPKVAAPDLDTGNGPAVPADLFDGHADALSTYQAPGGAGGGPAVGLGGFGSIDAVQSHHGSPPRARAELDRVPVSHVRHETGERLSWGRPILPVGTGHAGEEQSTGEESGNLNCGFHSGDVMRLEVDVSTEKGTSPKTVLKRLILMTTHSNPDVFPDHLQAHRLGFPSPKRSWKPSSSF
jgi:hypothetical protein